MAASLTHVLVLQYKQGRLNINHPQNAILDINVFK